MTQSNEKLLTHINLLKKVGSVSKEENDVYQVLDYCEREYASVKLAILALKQYHEKT